MRHLVPSLICLSLLAGTSLAAGLTPQELLGKQLFFDANLSNPAGQSCASCHAPEVGFSGPVSSVNQQTAVYAGAVSTRSGNRKPPSVAYASFSPSFSYDSTDETYVGGQFWDGRALNLVEQAKGPFLNPLEMNNASAAEVVDKVRRADYRNLLTQVYGEAASTGSADDVFDMIAQAIAAYESSREVNSFSSKYDASLAGRVQLSAQEQRGLDLFINKANCTACHPHDPDSDGNPPLFTDFTYDNVGAPRNLGNPFYRMPAQVNADGTSYRDLGLGGSLQKPEEWGKVKVPTLRNVGRKPAAAFTKAYLHNGVFKSIKEVVHFYNARDTSPTEFGSPDVVENVNREELGNLQLTDAEENDLVAFLETLSDGYFDPDEPSNTPGAQPAAGVAGDARFRAAGDIARVLRFRSRPIPAAQRQGPPPR